jgi:hypothetical protein
MSFVLKKCADKDCNNEFKQYNSLVKYCGPKCQNKNRKPNLQLKSLYKPIKQVSDKRKVENAKYLVLRIEFLGRPENQKCPITGKPTTDVHHMKGRIGRLLLDTRYWVALSRDGHKYVEENPEWAKENGYSLNRLTND